MIGLNLVDPVPWVLFGLVEVEPGLVKIDPPNGFVVRIGIIVKETFFGTQRSLRFRIG